MTLYIGIDPKPPTTMMDLEMAAMPSKSIVTVIQPLTAHSKLRQPSLAKIELQTKPSSVHWNWHHCSSTQSYVHMHNDPLPAATMHHAITPGTKHVEQTSHQLSSTTTDKCLNCVTICATANSFTGFNIYNNFHQPTCKQTTQRPLQSPWARLVHLLPCKIFSYPAT